MATLAQRAALARARAMKELGKIPGSRTKPIERDLIQPQNQGNPTNKDSKEAQ
ncbi:hypothetical protein [Vibrio parahaemolyticus]|uniref:hypothetical protein n=1 Tax=Vibrio parahaemolyticus TaxID=670 RepID=UPI0015DE22E3|nr:hypothetical protein [Vibrio parahaemolyticus]